jgi:predicted small secreted protein
MNRIVIIAIGVVIGLLTTGCNTMEGMGKDIKKGGEKIERSAEKNK